jgi:hypothetical protein
VAVQIAAMAFNPETGENTGRRGRPDTGVERAAKAAGVTSARFHQALEVREHAPHLAPDVIDGR